MVSGFRWSVTCQLRRLVAVSVVVTFLAGSLFGQGVLIHKENFEGGDSGYELIGGDSYEEPDPALDWSPGIWGLNTIGDQIGLQSTAPARRAAIQWDHQVFADVFADEAYATWVPLVDWAAGVTDPAARADQAIGFFGGFLEESVEAVKDALVGAGYSDDNMLELFAAEEVVPEDVDTLIHSSVQSSTLFSAVEVPVISFSQGDHDDAAIAGIGTTKDYLDGIDLEIPEEHRDHPALGGLGKDGTIPWTTEAAALQGIGKTHNGGKAIAVSEDPVTGALTPAIFVIEEGAPLLGAFNPDPEGEQYIVGSALNKHGPVFDGEPEAILDVGPIDISGHQDVHMTVALAATAADFENGDYVRIEVSADGDEFEILDEFFGVDEAHDPANDSGCLKGLSNGDEPGAVGEVCLPTESFADVTYALPQAGEVTLRFALLNTWGNEIVGIDNIRVHTTDKPPIDGGGAVDPPLRAGDADQDLDFDQFDLVKVQVAAKYLSGQAATWGDGDWDGAPGGKQGDPPAGNGFFDQLDIVAALGAGTYLQGPYAALAGPGQQGDDQTSLVYDAGSGELSVDAPAGKELTSINITSAGGQFIGDKPAALDGAFDNFAADNVFKATFGGSFGSISFGNVLPAGISEAEVTADLSAVGSLAGGGDLGNVDLVYIPEPTALATALIGIGMLALNRRRRRA